MISLRLDERPWNAGMQFKRITVNPKQMGGVPCVKGLRIPVATVVSLVAESHSADDIVAAYPNLEAEDVREALLFAAEAVRERVLPLAADECGFSSITRSRRSSPHCFATLDIMPFMSAISDCSMRKMTS